MSSDSPKRVLNSLSGSQMLRQFQANETGLGDLATYKVNYEYTFTLTDTERAEVDKLVEQGATKKAAVQVVMEARGR